MAPPTFDLVHTDDPDDDHWHVVLVAANGEPLMSSENFPTQRDARKNVSAVRRAVMRPALVDVKQ